MPLSNSQSEGTVTTKEKGKMIFICNGVSKSKDEQFTSYETDFII